MSKCILVVDDDFLSVELVKRTLQSKGYEIMTAKDGQEALDMMGKKAPDLILLDVQMPKMNGYTFIIEKAKIPAIADIPVFVLTVSKETEPLFKRHGVKAYLLKPLNTEDMLNKIQAFLPP